MNNGLDIQATNVFDLNWVATKRIVINRGGTRAGKTYAIMQLFALWLLTGQFRQNLTLKKGVASVVRKTLPALKSTAQKDFEEILELWGVMGMVTHHKTDRYYKYADRIVEFFSVDNEQKVRGRKRNILFCNEANELDFKTDFFQLIIRTTDAVILDFNPSDPSVWIKTELEDKRAHKMGDVETIVTTYKDNPFLDKNLVREIEAIEDPQARKVYVYGQYGEVTGVIFKNIKITPDDAFPTDLKKKAIGLDFGFTNDPTAAYMCGIQNGEIHVKELFYKTALTNPDIAELLRPYGHVEVICDNAEPKSIEELRRLGIIAKPARKGKDSIIHGINLLKQYRINITASSSGIIAEQKKYTWKKVKTIEGQTIDSNRPIDAFNHAWDAVRYWALIKLRKKGGSLLAIG